MLQHFRLLYVSNLVPIVFDIKDRQFASFLVIKVLYGVWQHLLMDAFLCPVELMPGNNQSFSLLYLFINHI